MGRSCPLEVFKGPEKHHKYKSLAGLQWLPLRNSCESVHVFAMVNILLSSARCFFGFLEIRQKRVPTQATDRPIHPQSGLFAAGLPLKYDPNTVHLRSFHRARRRRRLQAPAGTLRLGFGRERFKSRLAFQRGHDPVLSGHAPILKGVTVMKTPG